MSIPLSCLIIIGVGLLGSSIGLAAKKRNLASTVIGIGHRRETLDIALRRGAVDSVSTDIGGLACADGGLAVICTPVRNIVEYAEKISAVNADILLSDVGSTKGNICRKLENRQCRFIGAHPIAGSEKSGPEFGDADLFLDRLTVLTPTFSSRPKDVETLKFFWESLGSRVICLEPEYHDRVLAKTSHLPHVAAAALVSVLEESDYPFCGTGFADTTRIAAGLPAVWTDILMENRQELLAALEEYGNCLESMKEALRQGDSHRIAQFLLTAQRVSAILPPIHRSAHDSAADSP